MEQTPVVAPVEVPVPVTTPAVASPAIVVAAEQPVTEAVKPDKRRHFLAAFFLSFMFGVFGVDRFYLGKYMTGILKLVSFGGFGFWAMIDLSLIMSGSMRDKQGNELIDAVRYKKFARNFSLIFSFVIVFFLIVTVASVVFTITQFMNSGGLMNLIPGVSGLELQPAGGSNTGDIQQVLDQLKSMNL